MGEASSDEKCCFCLPSDKGSKPRQYISDRVRGKSEYDGEGRPPCFLCYVPPPVYRWSNLMEQNPCCFRWGKVGCIDPTNAKVRKRFMSIGLFANIVALVLSLFACFAVSTDKEILRNNGFSHGVVKVLDIPNVTDSIIDIGLKGVAFFNTTFDVSISFDTFCEDFNRGLNRYVQPNQCSDCDDASNDLVSSIILSTILVLPSITTDILRMYPNYDVNCQKFYANIVSCLSMLLSLQTLLRYNNACFASFYDGTLPFYRNGTAASAANDETVQVSFDWSAGNGLICILTATCLKIVDIIAHCVVPTPSITRDVEEQQRYELEHGDQQEMDVDEEAPQEEKRLEAKTR